MSSVNLCSGELLSDGKRGKYAVAQYRGSGHKAHGIIYARSRYFLTSNNLNNTIRYDKTEGFNVDSRCTLMELDNSVRACLKTRWRTP